GGGTIATDKVEGLLRAGAEVVVVSPEVSPHLARLAAEDRIEIRRRPYRRDDLEGVYLAYGATDDRAANAEVTRHARAAGILVNAVDDIPNCDFFAVAVVRRGDLQVSISTNGKSPAFARWMREYLDASLPAELGDLLALLGDARRDLKARGSVPPYERWQAAIDDDVLDRLRRGDNAGARERILDVLASAEASSAPATRWEA
ncbi:MAG: bifunctional precorrin-2 dehydrogenase/sirohydrochlorin ferrochelatase, partial [Chloroflexi bacterium]|nr:bifunctional precorrin-2 dehydrogenase/sirohydrochlorin ferrochelatase [Chloroflexota bacterium]